MDVKDCGAVKALSPRRIRAYDLLGRILTSIPGVAAALLGGTILASVINALISENGLASIRSTAIGLAVKLLGKLGVKVGEESLRRAVDYTLSWVTDRGRDDFISSLAQFIKNVNGAWLYLNNEGCIGVINEVANEWGMDTDQFKNFIGNVHSLTTEDLRRKLNDLRSEIKELRSEVSKQWLRDYMRIGWLEDFEGGKVYHNILVENDKLLIRVGGGYREYEVVTTKAFLERAKEVEDRLKSGRGFIIVTGPRGIGKSTLVAWVLWNKLRSGEVTSIIVAEELEDVEKRHDLLNLLRECDTKYSGICGLPVIIYDPSPPTYYTEPEAMKAVRNVNKVLDFLKNTSKEVNIPVIAVISTDMLTNESREEFRGFIYELDLRDKVFIKELVREYSGCTLDDIKLNEIAENILKFNEGHALIARLVGEEVRHSNCEVKNVEDLLDKASGNAMAFMVNYINMLLRINDERVGKFSRLLPIRYWLVKQELAEPSDYVMPSGLVWRWLEWEGVYGYVEYPQGEELKRTVSHWLAQKHHSLIEKALELITLASAIDMGSASEPLRQRLEFMRNAPQPLRDALDLWIRKGEKLPSDVAEKLLNPSKPSYEDVINYFNYFLGKYGDKLIQEFRLECWRRLALIAGAAVSRYPFSPLVEAVEDFLKGGRDVFPGLAEAVKPCSIDDILLEGGGFTPFSVALLIFGYDIYRAYADKWGEVTNELRGLRETLLRRREYSLIEAVYALGLATLTARARHTGQSIDVETAKTALLLASSSVKEVGRSLAMDDVIGLLRPLRDQYLDGWASLLKHAANVKVTKLVREELKEVYGHVSNLGDWAKAELAYAYAKAAAETFKIRGEAYKAYLNMACSLLDEIRDGVLKTIARAHVYLILASADASCPNADPCKGLEDINQRLEKLREETSNPREFLDSHPELEEYLRWRGVGKPEEELNKMIKETHAFALSGLGICALIRGDSKAKDYFSEASEISRELGHWENYLIDRRRAISAMALMEKDLGKIVNEFKDLWDDALQMMKPGAPYLRAAAYVFGGYLVALALMGRRGDVEKLLEEYGWLLDEYMDRLLNVAARLALKYLGVNVEAPSSEEVLKAVWVDLRPELQPAIAEILGIHIPIEDVPSLCGDIEVKDSALCVYAYAAVKNGNKVAEESVRRFIVSWLGKNDDLHKLLNRADIRQLIEVSALVTSTAHFILLLRALASGDRDLAILHAEVGRMSFSGFVGELFGGLADALKRGGEGGVKRAVAKLYYYHFF